MYDKSNGGIISVIRYTWEAKQAYQLYEVRKLMFHFC